MPTIKFIDLGVKDYKETWDMQEELFAKVMDAKNDPAQADFGGYLLFVEHPHVYTLGKSGEDNNLLISDERLKQIDATYYHTNRGGDITYHGPGQIVGYPIFNLEKFGIGVREYINKLEDAIIQAVADYGIPTARLDGATGVWLDGNTPRARKICAIGVRVSRYVTMHGFALNINTNLDYFSYINPCGFQDKGVTSVAKETGNTQDFEKAKTIVKEKLIQTFDFSIE
ncbi:MAG: lipoyl(octanoyl) transferase LipB [Bacteroidota bacterium]|nr:lipoyl(octanoyl) transferase LipB [Bacteroidota bacterium]